MILIKNGIEFFLRVIIGCSIFPIVLTSNDSLLHQSTTCTKPVFQNEQCSEIFTTVAVHKITAPNKSPILRNDSSYITTDGFLIMEKELYTNKEYCIVNSINESSSEVQVCKRNCYQNSTWRPCIPKCCLWGEYVMLDMNTGNGMCVPSNERMYTWKPDIYNNEKYLEKLQDQDYAMGFNPHYYYPKENIQHNCKSVWMWHSDFRFSFHMLQNGFVRWRYQTNKWFTVRSSEHNDKFCMEKMQNSSEHVLHICYSDLIASSTKNRYLYASLAFLSAVYMFLLLMVYGFLWKEQNSHGWIQFLFFLSLFFFYFLEGVGLLLIPEDLHIRPACYILSVTHHFFLTLATTTLVTLSWDIFWAFFKMYPNPGQQKSLRRFYISATVSCSCAFAFVFTGVAMNLAQSPYGPPYGLLFCTGSHWTVGKYLQGGFILFSLITLFATFFVIYRHKAATKILITEDHPFYRELGKVFLKIIIVNGMTWTCIMIIKFLKHYKDRLRYNDLLHAIYNGQSLLLFVLFACDKRKLNSLRDKYPRIKALSDALCSLCRRKIRKIDNDQPLVPLLKNKEAR